MIIKFQIIKILIKFFKNNLKITYLISNLIWWNLNFKKYFGSYSFDYREKFL